MQPKNRPREGTLEERLDAIRARNPRLFEALAKDDPSLITSAEPEERKPGYWYPEPDVFIKTMKKYEKALSDPRFDED